MERLARIFSACALIVVAGFFLATVHASAFENAVTHRIWTVTEYEFWQVTRDGTKVEETRMQIPSTLRIVEERTAYTMLGLNLYDIDGRPNALEVIAVFEGSAGKGAGIQVGDVVIALNGQPFTFGKFDWSTNRRDETFQKWRALNDLFTAKDSEDLVLTIERNGVTQDISIYRKWIEAERFRRSLILTKNGEENSPTVTIRILPEDFILIQPDTRDEIVTQWQNEGNVLIMYTFEPPFLRGHAYTDSGEVVDVGRLIVMIMAGTKFIDTDEEYRKELRLYDNIKNATGPLLLTLEVTDISAAFQTDGLHVLKNSIKWGVPPDIQTLVLSARIVSIQGMSGK